MGLDAVLRIASHARCYALTTARLPDTCELVGSVLKKKRVQIPYNSRPVGAWRSLVAHLHGVQGVPSSNLGAPTSSPIESSVSE